MEVFTPNGETAGNLLFMGSNADPESGAELPERGGLRNHNADDNGGDRVPEHAPRVQRQWQLRRRLPDTVHSAFGHTNTFGRMFAELGGWSCLPGGGGRARSGQLLPG